MKINLISGSGRLFCLAHDFVIYLLLLIFIIICSGSGAYAAFHEQLIIDARSLSLANSVTAEPENVMAIHFNPAALSDIKEDKTFGQGFGIIKLDIRSEFQVDPENPPLFNNFTDDPVAGTSGKNDGITLYIPYLGSIDVPFYAGPLSVGLTNRHKDSKWTFANAFYMPYAGGYYHDDPKDPARFDAEKLYLERLIYASPTASYKVNESLSFGFGVGVGQNSMGMNLQLRAPNEMIAMTKALGDATAGASLPLFGELILPSPWFGGGVPPFSPVARLDTSLKNNFCPSYNIGLKWAPADYFSFGAVFQSASTSQLAGHYTIQYSEEFQRMVNWMGQGIMLPAVAAMLDLPTKAEAIQSGNAVLDIDFPRRLQAGVMVKPIDRLKLFCDAKWSQWSVVKNNTLIFDQDIQLLRFLKLMGYLGGPRKMVLTRNLRDTLHFGFGTEFALTDKLFLRAGYEFRPTSVRGNRYDLQYFMPDINNYTAGVGYHFENGIKIDLGASYQVNTDYRRPNGSSNNLNGLDFTKPVYNPYAGLDFKQETSIYLCAMHVSMPLNLATEMLHKSLEITKNIVTMGGE